MNDIFSPLRFWNYIKLYAGENRKKLTQWVLTIFGIMIFGIVIFPIFKGYYNAPLPYDPAWDKITSFVWPVMFFCLISVSAFAFNSYDSKQKRIYTLSFPASTLEKYLTYFLIYCVGSYLLIFSSIIIADYLRVFTAPLYATKGCIIKPIPLSYLLFDADMASAENQIAVMAASMFVMSLQAFFFLVSAIWPKASFRKGFLSLVCIGIGWNILLFTGFQLAVKIYGPIYIFRFRDAFMHLDQYLNIPSILAIGYSVGIAVILGMYILAYFRFKEMESIERW